MILASQPYRLSIFAAVLTALNEAKADDGTPRGIRSVPRGH